MQSLWIGVVLCGLLAFTEYLVARTRLRALGTALLLILFAAIAANLGIIPAGSTEDAPVPLYEGIFIYLAPLSIFWLLLRVNLQDILRAGLPLISLFLIGALGTTLGVFVGMLVIQGPESIGPNFAALGGMFVGTYTGGSVNFNALALNYDMMRNAALYGGSIVVDNIMTTIWMIATLSLPVVLGAAATPKTAAGGKEEEIGDPMDIELVSPFRLGIVILLGLGSLLIADATSAYLSSNFAIHLPSIIVLTLIALGIAQLPIRPAIKGAQTLGMFSVYLFLAVIGAFCDVQALQELGGLGVSLLFFVLITVTIHGFVTFGAAWLLGWESDLAAVASQANVGGGTSALALARSRGRQDLVLPAVLLGSLGSALGTFLGFWSAEYILPLLAS